MSWHATPEARRLLAAILSDRPEPAFLKRYAWVNAAYPKYQTPDARAFRRIWQALRDEAAEANDRALWSKLGEQHPDDVIAAMLAERADLEPKELPNGRFQVAA